MAFRKLIHAYHDALLKRCRLGRQREVVLDIQLDPVWNRHSARRVSVRFGPIRNFDDVRAFFEKVQEAAPREDVLDELVGIVCEEKGKWMLILREMAR